VENFGSGGRLGLKAQPLRCFNGWRRPNRSASVIAVTALIT
jgi:hypothetical protein